MNSVSETFTHRGGELRAAFLVTLSAILYGFLGYFGASLLNLNLSISSMLFWRFAIAAVWMFVAMRIKWKTNIRAVSNKSTLIFLILSSICYCTACTFYFMASQLTGTGIAMVIYFAYPMFVVFMVMLKERTWVDKNTLISLVIIIIGLIFLKGSSQNEAMSRMGVLFALASAFFFAGYVYTSKFISNALPSNLLTFILCLSNALLFFIFATYTHTLIFPTTIKMWVFVCGLGIIATALPIQLMLEGLKTISASKASILSALEPAVTLFVGMLLLNEEVSNIQMLGAFFILLSAVYIQFANQKNKRAKLINVN